MVSGHDAAHSQLVLDDGGIGKHDFNDEPDVCNRIHKLAVLKNPGHLGMKCGVSCLLYDEVNFFLLGVRQNP